MNNQSIKALEFDPKDIQNKASDPQFSCFVSASAGTGKTTVLVNRFLRLMLQSNVPPQNILCITYTNNAADEVKERILTKLNVLKNSSDIASDLSELIPNIHPQVAKNFDDSYNKFIEKYQELKVYTIHSFCYQVLQQYWNVKSQSTKQIIENNIAESAISQAINHAILSYKDDATQLFKHYELSYIQDTLHQALNYHAISRYNFGYEELSLNPMEEFHNSDISRKFKECCDVAYSSTEDMEAALYNAFFTKSGTARKKPNLSCFVHIEAEMLKAVQQSFCEAHERSIEFKFQKLNNHFGTLFACMLQHYTAFKQEKLVLDFNDIISNTLGILHEDPDAIQVLYQLDLAIDHILIDEAQDTSPMQWEIIKLISAEYYSGLNRRDFSPTIFIVGDFKQSIYSFQGANPSCFLDAKEYFKALILGVNGNFYDLEFKVSFRSEPTILNYVDKVFAPKAFAHAISGTLQTIEHLPFKSQHGSVVLNRALDADSYNLNLPKNRYSKSENPPHPEELLAAEIFIKIQHDVKHRRILSGDSRCIQYSDIMVIFRKRSKSYYKLIELFDLTSIPVSSNKVITLDSSKELQYIRNIIKFVLFPYDDCNLYELLKSPFFQIANDIITKIFYNRVGLCGFESAKEREPQLYNKLCTLIKLRNLDLTSFLEKIFIEFNHLQRFILHFGPAFKDLYDGLLHAVSTKNNGAPISLLEFNCHYIEKLRIHEHFNNEFEGIKVITAHAAKGLQSKVVILADTTTTDNQPYDLVIENHKTKQLMFIPKQSLQPKVVQEYLQHKKLLDYSENLRLLYVALTRAENEIHIFGRKSKSIKNSWYHALKEAYGEGNALLSENLYDTKGKCNEFMPYDFIELPKYNGKSFEEYSQEMITFDEIQEAASHQIRLYNKGLQHGSIIHTLLHKLPDCFSLEELNAIALGKMNYNSTEEDSKEFTQELQLAARIINTHPSIFYADVDSRILSEVEVGLDKSTTSSHVRVFCKARHSNYVIDKLIITCGEVKIVDFKTDSEINSQSIKKYRIQLQRYGSLIRKIYPDHIIKSYLLFCHNYNKLMEV